MKLTTQNVVSPVASISLLIGSDVHHFVFTVSVHFKSSDVHYSVFTVYQDKVPGKAKVGGEMLPDPYGITKDQWQDDVSKWPTLEFGDVIHLPDR